MFPIENIFRENDVFCCLVENLKITFEYLLHRAFFGGWKRERDVGRGPRLSSENT
jgi:hypothetical protein